MNSRSEIEAARAELRSMLNEIQQKKEDYQRRLTERNDFNREHWRRLYKDGINAMSARIRRGQDMDKELASLRKEIKQLVDKYNSMRQSFNAAVRSYNQRARASSSNFGTGESGPGAGGSRTFTPPVHGVDSSGNPVTVAFGRGSQEEESLITDDHVENMGEFYGSKGAKGHDHLGPGVSERGDRGKYTGD